MKTFVYNTLHLYSEIPTNVIGKGKYIFLS